MRNLMKLIATTAMTALLLLALIICATADEKIYTSDTFTLPLDRLEKAEEIFDAREQAEAAALAEQEATAEPGEESEVPEESQTPAEGEQPEEGQTPTEGEQPAEGQTPAEGEQPEGQTPAEGEQPEGQTPAEGEQPEESQTPAEGQQPEECPAPEGTEDPDEDEEPDEDDEDEGLEELDDDAGEVTEEPVEEKRRVVIRSSQGAIVTEGDQITLTSELYGFGDHLVEYQWQVDKGEGAGWEDINGGDRYKYTFIANRETIRYSWRLIVNVIDE